MFCIFIYISNAQSVPNTLKTISKYIPKDVTKETIQMGFVFYTMTRPKVVGIDTLSQECRVIYKGMFALHSPHKFLIIFALSLYSFVTNLSSK